MPTLPANCASFFAHHGYYVLPEALSSGELRELHAETLRICRGDAGDVQGVTPAAPDEPDDAVLRRYICIHMAHKISPLMHRYLAHPRIVEVLTQVIGPNVKCMQSMLFIKASGKPGQAWHQDEDFIPTRDRSLTGAWIALDDATVENGCLWVIPGSHKPGILWDMRQHDDARFDCTDESFGFPYNDDDAIPVEVKAGSIVFFNGYLLHRSLPNRASGGYRRAFVNHYMSAESFLPWHNPGPGEWVSRSDYRDIVLVAGRDPYAYKGTTNLAQPHVRRDREGGCKPVQDDS
ncbi:MAG: phytanoyl-CoA dioxygenase family protein [Chloroflexaceae bacterium]|jgi:ectoine hydroxylase-related dioxygenase (phytanoyl-CoA dioxygenase family)|nr:phytanoyl-CoA dioxygenase family protein [Chloroflexaceae bacterium]